MPLECWGARLPGPVERKRLGGCCSPGNHVEPGRPYGTRRRGTASWTWRYRAGRGAWAYLLRSLDRAACLGQVNRPETPGGLILEACSPEVSERRQFTGPSLVGLLVLLRGAVLGAQASGPSFIELVEHWLRQCPE
ncbi:hypothetical protein NDU88_001671 [Pleurodeles waltl]|uniref:Uncharacterized protein n=1 Tax=Pleurodeles waltl TaxID=8319 RepID=A0AAV7S9L1_PLEWA|nr:hypothetical protein NDU88_001671 [Pleurodeles waltl]